MHKNNKDAFGNYCVYAIFVNNVIYKIGKADLDRVTKISGEPTRVHQQLRKLRRKYGVGSVYYNIIEYLYGYKTEQALAFEQAVLQLYMNKKVGYQKVIKVVLHQKYSYYANFYYAIFYRTQIAFSFG